MGQQGTPGLLGPTGPAGATGVAGTTGQLAVRVASTAAVTLPTNGGALIPIPGLTTTVTVPASASVYVSADGGVTTNSFGAGDGAMFQVYLVVDGALNVVKSVVVENGAFASSITNFSLANTFTGLSTGPHTFTISTLRSQATAGLSSPMVCGNSASTLQCGLNVLVLKQ